MIFKSKMKIDGHPDFSPCDSVDFSYNTNTGLITLTAIDNTTLEFDVTDPMFNVEILADHTRQPDPLLVPLISSIRLKRLDYLIRMITQ